MADHWCKAASEGVARTRDPFAFVDAPAFLAQGGCDEVLVIHPNTKCNVISCDERLASLPSTTFAWRSRYSHSFCCDCPGAQYNWGRGGGRMDLLRLGVDILELFVPIALLLDGCLQLVLGE